MIRGLLLFSCLVFAVTGFAYVAVPGLALAVVGIESSPASDFLLRTEGVPLLFGAALLWAARHAPSRLQRTALFALAGYYVVSSVVDLAAHADGVVGPASVPSAVVRIAIGAICGVVAWRSGRSPVGADAA